MLGVRGRGGVFMSRAPLWLLIVAAIAPLGMGVAACDRFEPPAGGATASVMDAEAKARLSAKEALTRVIKAAQAATAGCAAGDAIWEADEDGYAVSRHYSRPCIPESCSTTPAQIGELRASAQAAKALVSGDRHLGVPSFVGFIALAEAMVGFAETATAPTVAEKDRPARLSGLSMHYSALAAAFREIYPDAGDVPLEPPSLTKSLEVPQPGGDPCKGWGQPQYCDVKELRLPKARKWRTNPACVEVESVRR